MGGVCGPGLETVLATIAHIQMARRVGNAGECLPREWAEIDACLTEHHGHRVQWILLSKPVGRKEERHIQFYRTQQQQKGKPHTDLNHLSKALYKLQGQREGVAGGLGTPQTPYPLTRPLPLQHKGSKTESSSTRPRA